jgi:uncharacterized membrane protein YfcA
MVGGFIIGRLKLEKWVESTSTTCIWAMPRPVLAQTFRDRLDYARFNTKDILAKVWPYVIVASNAISVTFASVNCIRCKLLSFKTAVPIIILAVFFSPLGAYSTRDFSEELLILIFSAFFLFAGSMMLFYSPETKTDGHSSSGKELKTGIGLGIGAGYLGGLLGLGGGNFIVPALVWLGSDSKRASADSIP